MKAFEKHSFSLSACEQEFSEFERLLDENDELDELAEILPFFRKSKNLAVLISQFKGQLLSHKELAYEYPLWGDFGCDLVITDVNRENFCFVEFEHYHEDNIFKKTTRSTTEYAKGLEHGFSQLIDWFWRIDGFKNTNEMRHKFGNDTIDYIGILIIGRSRDLDEEDRRRLKWRADNLNVAAKKIYYLTFDELRQHFKDSIAAYIELLNKDY